MYNNKQPFTSDLEDFDKIVYGSTTFTIEEFKEQFPRVTIKKIKPLTKNSFMEQGKRVSYCNMAAVFTSLGVLSAYKNLEP